MPLNHSDPCLENDFDEIQPFFLHNGPNSALLCAGLSWIKVHGRGKAKSNLEANSSPRRCFFLKKVWPPAIRIVKSISTGDEMVFRPFRIQVQIPGRWRACNGAYESKQRKTVTSWIHCGVNIFTPTHSRVQFSVLENRWGKHWKQPYIVLAASLDLVLRQ